MVARPFPLMDVDPYETRAMLVPTTLVDYNRILEKKLTATGKEWI
jgi:hypothetical protein